MTCTVKGIHLLGSRTEIQDILLNDIGKRLKENFDIGIQRTSLTCFGGSEREMLNKILHISEDTKKRGPNLKIRIHL